MTGVEHRQQRTSATGRRIPNNRSDESGSSSGANRRGRYSDFFPPVTRSPHHARLSAAVELLRPSRTIRFDGIGDQDLRDASPGSNRLGGRDQTVVFITSDWLGAARSGAYSRCNRGWREIPFIQGMLISKGTTMQESGNNWACDCR
jgi:hypothetical protein